MSTHQSTDTHRAGSSDANHLLNVRLLRFRRSPDREDPALLAQALIAHDRHEDALELLDLALSREQGDPDLELLRGRALLGAGEVGRAKETLIRAAKAAPGWAAPFTWLTRALSVGGETARAAAAASRAASLGADDTQVVRMAKGHAIAQRLSQRVARYDAAPDAEEPVMLARELALAGRADDAERVLRAALARDADDADTLAALAQLERSSGRNDDAIALFRRARAVAPGWTTVERALHSLVGAEILVDETPELPVAASPTERERAVSVLDLDISVEPVETAARATDLDAALDLFLTSRREETMPYAVETHDTVHGLAAQDATMVGAPAPVREAPTTRKDLAQTFATQNRARRSVASGWPRRVVSRVEAVATPYVRVLVGDARPRTARA